MTVPWTPIGGVNLLADPTQVPDQQSVKLQNMYPYVKGKVQTRLGPQHVCISQNASDQSNRVPTNCYFPKFRSVSYALTSFDATSGNQFLNAGGMTGADWDFEQAMPALPGSYRPFMLEFGQRVLVLAGACDGAGRSVFEVSELAGVLRCIPAEIYFTDGNGNFFAPRTACNYRGRVVYANFGKGYEDVIVFSDDNDRPYKINAGGAPASQSLNITTAGGRSLKLMQLGGDKIIGMIDVMRQPEGSPADTALFVLGGHSAIPMPGVPLLTDDVPPTGQGYFGTLNPSRINLPTGCCSAETIARTTTGIIWANWNDVWVMDTGSQPRQVGSSIRSALMAGDPASRFTWHATYHTGTGSYRLALVSPGQDTSLQFGPNNACADQWWLDMRDGVQDAASARWFGPQQYRMLEAASTTPAHPGTFMMRVEGRDSTSERILGVHLMNATALRSGIRAPCVVEFDQTTGFDCAIPIIATLRTGTPADTGIWAYIDQQLGNEILWEMVSKEYDMGDPMVDKLYQGLELQLWTSELLGIGVEVSVDGGNLISEVDVQVEQRGWVAGVDPLGNRFKHQYQSLVVNPDQDVAASGKIFQLRVFNRPGWPVPVNGLDSAALMGPPVGALVSVPLTPALYASRVAFLTELCNEMQNANVDGSFSGYTPTVDGTTGAIKITNGSLNGWIWNFIGSLDPEVLRRSRKIAGMLGMDSTGTSLVAGLGAGVITAVDLVGLLLNPTVEIASAGIRVYAFGRKPSGESYEPNAP